VTSTRDRPDEPTSNRPHMPGYGLPDPTSPDGLLPWTWARERLAVAQGYWIATTRPDGRPHLIVVWGVWHHDRLFFSTAEQSRKARNVAADPRVSVGVYNAIDAVIVEGTASRASDPDDADVLRAAYKQKYGTPLPDDGDSPLYVVEPSVAFGFIETDEFTATATRWQFDR
jgi:nitroimidazol reductase NimA-like FMN-containing flavoprotein (pyridoxamine 5'-phosphate oxidase superfamily)